MLARPTGPRVHFLIVTFAGIVFDIIEPCPKPAEEAMRTKTNTKDSERRYGGPEDGIVGNELHLYGNKPVF